MELFDTHAHLSDEAFDEDRHSLIPKLFERRHALSMLPAMFAPLTERLNSSIAIPSFTEPSECIRTMFPQWIMR